MNVFKIRILVDDQDDFIREVEIKSNQTFKILHEFIVKNLKLGGNELASFHLTDDNWRKLQEITLIDMGGKPGRNGGKNTKVRTPLIMAQTKLGDVLDDIDQKLLYEYDFLQMHTFRLEVIDIINSKTGITYPVFSYSKGRLQLQDNVRVEKDSDKLKQDLLKDFNSILNDDSDDDDFGVDDDY